MTVSNRAYSLLEIKGMDEDKRILTGLATTPTVDRMGDVVDPKGAEFKLPIPFLWQHDSRQPIGSVTKAKVTADGIEVEIKIQKTDEPGLVKDRLDSAWQDIKLGLVRGLSIGFAPIESAQIDGTWGQRFIKWLWLELSGVTIAANGDCSIQTIKSIDTAIRAATGNADGESRPVPPGASGKSTKPVNLRPKEATKMKTIQEQIAALEAKRSATAARMAEIMQKGADDGRTTDAAEQEEFDNLEAELAPIDADLKRFKSLEKAQIATVRPVSQEIRTVEAGTAARSRAPVLIKRDYPKGTGFIRLIASKWVGHQRGMNPADIAKQMFGDMPEVEMVLRAGIDASNLADMLIRRTAVTPMSTTDGSSGANYLVIAENLASEFFELLRAATIVGRIPNLRRVPFNISVPRQLTDPIGYWVGQGDQKPVSSFTLDQVTLAFHKAAGIVPITEELARFSNPAAEGIIRSALIGALTYRTDRDFLDPSKAETTGVSPASVTNGVTPIAATGTTADAFRADLGNLIATYLGLNMSPAGLVLIMTSTQAMKLGLMRNTLGQKEFPDIGINGGEIEGIPVITSENIVSTGSSPVDGYPIVAINAPEVMLADEGGVTIDVSREASLQMNDAPDSPETASTVLVSLWQRNMVAFKAERYITWKKGRTGAVQFINYARYSE